MQQLVSVYMLMIACIFLQILLSVKGRAERCHQGAIDSNIGKI